MADQTRIEDVGEKIGGEKEPSTYLSRPRLDHLQRTGLPDEREGRDISPDDFVEIFGFLCCGFSGWLTQSERQDLSNRAYDAFCTLACILNVDKTFLSLNGTLALTFGAFDGVNTPAHYKTVSKIINVPRLEYAGNLAHEFWHALDHCFGEYIKPKLAEITPWQSLESLDFATEIYSNQERRWQSLDYVRNLTFPFPQHGIVPNVCGICTANLKPLMLAVHALLERPYTVVEAKRRVEADLDEDCRKLRDGIYNWFNTLPLQSDNEVSDHIAQQITKDVYQKIIQGDHPDCSIVTQHSLVKQLIERQSQASQPLYLTNLPEDIQVFINRLLFLYPIAANREALLQSGYYKNGATHSRYFNDAQTLDKEGSKPSWSLPHKLAARAFEAFVQDQCRKLNCRDDFLVHGTQEERFLACEVAPYPMGQDRKRTHAAFDGFMTFFKNKFFPSHENKDEETRSDVLRPKTRMT